MAATPVGFGADRVGTRKFLLLAVLVLLAALLPRLWGICASSLHADERHWVERSQRIVHKVTHDPSRVTSHLGHPGVVPALVMSAGQVFASQANRITGAESSDAWYLDAVSGSRIANAIFSSLLPLLLLGALWSWTTPLKATSVAALVALSPRFIDLSRIAHVDTIHAVVVCLTVFLYLCALRDGQPRYKFFAGIGFGLCLLCKPTSIALVPGLLLVKAVLARLWTEGFRERSLSWGDVWLVVTALVVFVLLYSRMWSHGGSYIEWRDVSHAGPHVLFEWGKRLGSGLVGAVLFVVLGGAALWLRNVAGRDGAKRWWWHVATLVVGLFLSFLLFPAVWENMARYWMRVFNLTSVKHQSFAGAVRPPTGGYLTFILAEMPPLIVIGLLLSPLLFLKRLREALGSTEQQMCIVSAVVFSVWLAFLATSSKQSYRYLLPVVPFAYVVAVFTLCAIGRAFTRTLLPVYGAIGVQCLAFLAVFPAWDLYQSSFAPLLLDPAVRLELQRPRSGQSEVLAFLKAEAKKQGRELYVTVLGDGDVMRREVARHFSKADRKLLRFGYYPEYTADFVLVQNYLQGSDGVWERHLRSEPRMQYRKEGLTWLSVFEVLPENSVAHVALPASRLQTHSGQRAEQGGMPTINLTPGVSAAGYALVVPGGFKAARARYRVSFTVTGDSKIEASRSLSAKAPVARFEVAKACFREVSVAELQVLSGAVVVDCDISAARRISPRVFWFGKVPLSFGGIEITRVDHSE